MALSPRKPKSLRVLVTGASGLIGTELLRQLGAAGHSVRALVRREPAAADEVRWAPEAGRLDPEALNDVDAVVNLSGASLSRLPWTPGYKRKILESRIRATHTLTEAMRMAQTPPRTLLNASAVGFYGDRPGQELTEDSGQGAGFLAHVVSEWEAAAHTAPASTRVVTFRTGMVVAQTGAVRPIAALTRAGLGARMGPGRQYWPWISLHDEAAAIVHLLTSSLSGAVNLAGQTPAVAYRLTHRIAVDLNRPHALVVPSVAIRLMLGEAGRDLLLSDQRVLSDRLRADGFQFRHTFVEDAVDAALLVR